MSMDHFAQQYAQLNTQQKKAVDTIEGPVIVVAGPGTGKTQILTLRIANILLTAGAGIAPENILALTFTNAGVVAMRQRLATFIGSEAAYKTPIFTFHSFCEEQINRFPDFFPDITFARIATDIEKIHIIETILQEHDFTHLVTFGSDHHYIKDILRAIDDLKREGVDPQDFTRRIIEQEKAILADPATYYKRATKRNKKGDIKPLALKPVEKNRELCTVYDHYQEALRTHNLYDFTDMIMSFVTVADHNEDLAMLLREQYQYILVDEHQDTNDGQNRIIDILTRAEHLNDRPNLFTVGDEKQAIYRFQGASIDNFLHFEKKFEDAVVINLVDNYRSAQGILDHAHTLITSSDRVTEHHALSAYKKDEAHVCVKHFRTYTDELMHIANDIDQQIARGVVPEHIAVFYREHSNLPYIRDIFEKKGIPYVIATRQNVLDDNDIQKLITFLRVITDPYDDNALAQLLLLDIVSIDIEDALAILDRFRYVSRTQKLFQFLSQERDLIRSGVVGITQIRDLVTFILECKRKSENDYFVEFFEEFIRESLFLQYILSKKDHVLLLKKMSRIFDEVRELAARTKGCRLSDFIRHIDTYMAYDITMDVVRGPQESGVQLMTAHGSKGLEFEHVYITNVIHGLWGGKRSIKKFDLPINTVTGDIDDERRLFYVAITRAKRHLTISYADYDVNGRERMPSLFITDINARFIDIEMSVNDTCATLFAPRLRVVTSLISQDYIRDKFLSTQLSATALNNYFEAPIVYFFRNLVRLPSVQNKTMLYGSILHAALEQFFSASCDQNEVLGRNDLLGAFDHALRVMHIPPEYYDSIDRRGREALSGYWDRYHTTFDLDVELEKKIRGIPFLLDSGEEILLTGVIDKLIRHHDGTCTVVDYKTGKPWSKNTKEKKCALKRQVVFYKLLLDTYDDHRYTMTQGELDFIEPHPVTHEYEKELIAVNDRDVDALKKEINAFAHDILTGAFLDHSHATGHSAAHTDEYMRLLSVLKR